MVRVLPRAHLGVRVAVVVDVDRIKDMVVEAETIVPAAIGAGKITQAPELTKVVEVEEALLILVGITVVLPSKGKLDMARALLVQEVAGTIIARVAILSQAGTALDRRDPVRSSRNEIDLLMRNNSSGKFRSQ